MQTVDLLVRCARAGTIRRGRLGVVTFGSNSVRHERGAGMLDGVGLRPG
jgi:hypothetical protein